MVSLFIEESTGFVVSARLSDETCREEAVPKMVLVRLLTLGFFMGG